MPADADFLAAIVADPQADAPRLVYADWLDEQPDAASRDRAAFIRMQCAAAKLPPDTFAAKSLERDAATLLRWHKVAWVGAFIETLFGDRGPGFAEVWRADRFMFRRGFIERVEVPSVWYVERHAALHAAAPLREIVLPDYADLFALADVAVIHRVERLTFAVPVPTEVAVNLMRAVQAAFGHYRVLTGVTATLHAAFSDCYLRYTLTWGRPDAAPIQTALRFGRGLWAFDVADAMDIAFSGLNTEHLTDLSITVPRRQRGWAGVVSRLPPSLRRLTFAGRFTLADPLDLLRTSPALARLSRLDLSGCDGSDAAAAALAFVTSLGRPETLCVVPPRAARA